MEVGEGGGHFWRLGTGGLALVMGAAVWLPESTAVDKQMICLALPGVYEQETERLYCQGARLEQFPGHGYISVLQVLQHPALIALLLNVMVASPGLSGG